MIGCSAAPLISGASTAPAGTDRLIYVEDHPEAHGLITHAVRDLVAFASGDK